MISKIVLAQMKSEPLPKDNLIKVELKINEAKTIYNAEMVVLEKNNLLMLIVERNYTW